MTLELSINRYLIRMKQMVYYYGRDAFNGTWRAIHTLTGFNTTWSYNIPQYIGINATEYYDAFTLLVQKLVAIQTYISLE